MEHFVEAGPGQHTHLRPLSGCTMGVWPRRALHLDHNRNFVGRMGHPGARSTAVRRRRASAVLGRIGGPSELGL